VSHVDDLESQPPASWKAQDHLFRLHGLAELGIIGELPRVQLRRILQDARLGLAFNLAEVGVVEAGRYRRICSISDADYHLEQPIRERALTCTQPLVVFDIRSDPAFAACTRASAGIRSALFWPARSTGTRCVLSMAWEVPLREFITEEEIRYFDFLAALVSRLIDAIESGAESRSMPSPDIESIDWSSLRAHLTRAIAETTRTREGLGLLCVADPGPPVAPAQPRERLESVVRKSELCERFGEHVWLVIRGVHRDQDLEQIAHRIKHETNAGSVGFALCPRDGITPEDLIGHALAQIAAGSPAASQPEAPSLQALSHFVLCYQPIVSARSGEPLGAEVLPRWLEPQDVRSARNALDIAEAQRQLTEFDALVLRTAVQSTAALRQNGRLQIHVNLSQLDTALLEYVSSRGAAVNGMALELSEEQLASQPQSGAAFIRACRERGYRVGLARFGCGHLTLAALSQIHLDFVKISIRALRESTPQLGIDALRMLIDQAHHASSLVIAEAVESSAEQAWLVASGVDALQGYAIASPLTEPDFQAWLQYRGGR
jgi:EAL domain-containing protein (putative c-di-GMP-specific phosphodiesterase class I)